MSPEFARDLVLGWYVACGTLFVLLLAYGFHKLLDRLEGRG